MEKVENKIFPPLPKEPRPRLAIQDSYMMHYFGGMKTIKLNESSKLVEAKEQNTQINSSNEIESGIKSKTHDKSIYTNKKTQRSNDEIDPIDILRPNERIISRLEPTIYKDVNIKPEVRNVYESASVLNVNFKKCKDVVDNKSEEDILIPVSFRKNKK